MPPSTTNALSHQPLAQILQHVVNPRGRRGVRHGLPTILSLAVMGAAA
ncbi:hypothetical protein [Actinomyces bowdenii]|uniref:Transposase family protein n=1 Tax=Actinomyces bowdenii TaxID=131109 RepID=A0A853EMK5_9ACTO|nr:hypothetical protein [Actinomyces bowdenii]MBF0697567.1 hypothetical protein [Actinomyces bowdenii]NYS69740.1 hypothetical protein [Actinomyces bowdenii]